MSTGDCADNVDLLFSWRSCRFLAGSKYRNLGVCCLFFFFLSSFLFQVPIATQDGIWLCKRTIKTRLILCLVGSLLCSQSGIDFIQQDHPVRLSVPLSMDPDCHSHSLWCHWFLYLLENWCFHTCSTWR